MLPSNFIKIFLVCAAALCQACGFWQGKTDETAVTAPFVAEELKSAVPFSNKEPDEFQAEIVLIAGESEDKTFLARSGAKRLIVFNFQTESETGVLRLGDGQWFFLAPRRKIYAAAEQENAAAEDASADESLTAEWLNQKKDAAFVLLPPENNLTKYRVNLDESKNSEIIIYVDERIGLPVRQEFFAVSGEQRILTAAIELRNFNAPPDAKLFQVPPDYRKLTAKEYRETLRGERKK